MVAIAVRARCIEDGYPLADACEAAGKPLCEAPCGEWFRRKAKVSVFKREHIAQWLLGLATLMVTGAASQICTYSKDHADLKAGAVVQQQAIQDINRRLARIETQIDRVFSPARIAARLWEER